MIPRRDRLGVGRRVVAWAGIIAPRQIGAAIRVNRIAGGVRTGQGVVRGGDLGGRAGIAARRERRERRRRRGLGIERRGRAEIRRCGRRGDRRALLGEGARGIGRLARRRRVDRGSLEPVERGRGRGLRALGRGGGRRGVQGTVGGVGGRRRPIRIRDRRGERVRLVDFAPVDQGKAAVAADALGGGGVHRTLQRFHTLVVRAGRSAAMGVDAGIGS